MEWTKILEWAATIYGILTAIVKFVPTLGQGWLLTIIKFLGNITNRQTDDAAIRGE